MFRIIAIAIVVLAHSCSYFDQQSASYLIFGQLNFCDLVDACIKFSIPLFVMISGAFNINNKKNANVLFFYKKVCLKIFLPMLLIVFFFAMFCIIKSIIQHQNIFGALSVILTGDYLHYWFLYMLFGLYVLTPFVIKVKEKVSFDVWKWAVIIFFAWSVISSYFTYSDLPYSVASVMQFLGYYLMGNLIFDIKNKINKSTAIISVFLFIVFYIVAYFNVSFPFDIGHLHAWNNFCFLPSVFMSLSLFIIINKINLKPQFYKISKYVFYIYLLHGIVLSVLAKILLRYFTNQIFGTTILWLITFFVSLIIAIIFEKLWNIIIKNSKLKNI